MDYNSKKFFCQNSSKTYLPNFFYCQGFLCTVCYPQICILNVWHTLDHHVRFIEDSQNLASNYKACLVQYANGLEIFMGAQAPMVTMLPTPLSLDIILHYNNYKT